jgi:hypothetical protein
MGVSETAQHTSSLGERAAAGRLSGPHAHTSAAIKVYVS